MNVTGRAASRLCSIIFLTRVELPAGGMNLGRMNRTFCKHVSIQLLHISTGPLQTAHHVFGFLFCFCFNLFVWVFSSSFQVSNDASCI